MLCKHPYFIKNKLYRTLLHVLKICNINLCVKFMLLPLNAYVTACKCLGVSNCSFKMVIYVLAMKTHQHNWQQINHQTHNKNKLIKEFTPLRATSP
jgi:hypothetical protein